VTIKFKDFTFGHLGCEPLVEPYSDVWTEDRYLVCGNNGVGKTTLLATLAGLLAPKQGCVQFISCDDGQRDKAFVSSYVAIPDEVPLEYIIRLATKGVTAAQQSRLRSLLEVFSLAVKCKTFKELSLGSKQKFRIALGFFREPQFLLLDECYSALDDKSTEELTRVINDYPHTIVHATHEIRPEANWQRITIQHGCIERAGHC